MLLSKVHQELTLIKDPAGNAFSYDPNSCSWYYLDVFETKLAQKPDRSIWP